MDSKSSNSTSVEVCLKCTNRCKQGEERVMRRYEERLRSICTVHGNFDNYNEIHVRVRMKDNFRFGFIIDNVIWQEAFRVTARKLLNSSAIPEDVDAMGIELKTINRLRYNMTIGEEQIYYYSFDLSGTEELNEFQR